MTIPNPEFEWPKSLDVGPSVEQMREDLDCSPEIDDVGVRTMYRREFASLGKGGCVRASDMASGDAPGERDDWYVV